MIPQIYPIIHTLISPVAIFGGFVFVFGLLAGKRLGGWTKCVSHRSRREDDPRLNVARSVAISETNL